MDHRNGAEENYGPMVVGSAEGMDDHHGQDAPEVVEHYGNGQSTGPGAQIPYRDLPKYGGAAIPAAGSAAAVAHPVKLEPDNAAAQDFFRQSQHAPIDLGNKPSRWQRHKRLYIVLGVVLLIVIILAAVLGGVLGSRHKSTNNAAAPPTVSAVPAGQNVRVRSTQGAFNGSGMSVYYANVGNNYVGSIVYQDYTGAIKAMQYSTPNFNSVIGSDASVITTDAANGTCLSMAVYNDTVGNHLVPEQYQLIYINSKNILSDIWANQTHPNKWIAGNLSKLNFQAPTDNRPAVEITQNAPDSRFGAFTTQVFIGGMDGKMHALSVNRSVGTWTQDSVTFDNSWAYGGIDYGFWQTREGWNTTNYYTLADGSLHSQLGVDANVQTNQSYYPNSHWQTPAAVSTTGTGIAPNTSINVFWQYNFGGPESFLTYIDQTGRLQQLSLTDGSAPWALNDSDEAGSGSNSTSSGNHPHASPGSSSSAANVYSNYQMMLGTAVGYDPWDDYYDQGFNFILWHQTSGDDLSWIWLYANGTSLGKGSIDLPKI